MTVIELPIIKIIALIPIILHRLIWILTGLEMFVMMILIEIIKKILLDSLMKPEISIIKY
jgi:hypothetical protein